MFPGYYKLLEEYNFILRLKVFEKFNDPSKIKNMTEEKFYKEIDKIAQKIGQSLAGSTLVMKVYQLAKESYSSCPSNTSTQLIIDKSVWL